MSRISIDVSPELHKKLKALAALQGKTIKAYILERALGSIDQSQGEALAKLGADPDHSVPESDQGQESIDLRPARELLESIRENAIPVSDT